MPIAKKHYLEINEYSLVFFNKLKKELSPIAITHTMYQDHPTVQFRGVSDSSRNFLNDGL